MKTKKLLTTLAIVSVVLFTGCKKKSEPTPTPAPVTILSVTSISPSNNAIGIARNQAVTISFSMAMNPSTISNTNFTLKQGVTLVGGAVTYSGTTATFTPTNLLSVGTVYTAMVTRGVTNLAGDSLKADTSWSFTTGGFTSTLSVTSTNPGNNAIDVGRNQPITISFSMAMNSSTISNITFTLKQGVTPVSGAVTYSGTTAMFTPSNILAVGTAYTATVTRGVTSLAGDSLKADTVWNFTTGGSLSTLAVVDLGAAGNYVILAKTAINDAPTSAITGDLGISPAATSYMTGFSLTKATGYATASQVTGKLYGADMAAPTPINLTTAVNNMNTAYNDAAGRPSPDFVELYTGNIGGKTLLPGLYKWSNSVTVPSSVTISGGANDVWIFQIAGNLTLSSAVNVTLSGGAQAKNIFWQVAGTVSAGTNSHFEGIILSKTGITLQTGASLNGRALAQTAVILDKNVVKPQ